MLGSFKKLSQIDINMKHIPLNHKIGISECGQECVKVSKPLMTRTEVGEGRGWGEGGILYLLTLFSTNPAQNDHKKEEEEKETTTKHRFSRLCFQRKGT